MNKLLLGPITNDGYVLMKPWKPRHIRTTGNYLFNKMYVAGTKEVNQQLQFGIASSIYNVRTINPDLHLPIYASYFFSLATICPYGKV